MCCKALCYTMYAIVHIMIMVCCMQYLWPSIPHRDTILWRSIQHCDKIQQMRLSQFQAAVVLCRAMRATCAAACRTLRCNAASWSCGSLPESADAAPVGRGDGFTLSVERMVLMGGIGQAIGGPDCDGASRTALPSHTLSHRPIGPAASRGCRMWRCW